MTKRVRFYIEKVGPKWVALMMVAPKIEGLAFGMTGARATILGRFATKEEATAAIETKKTALRG